MTKIRTGDSVFHRPTGERWLVAYVDEDRDRIAWCGWPEGEALLSDCELEKSCSDKEHLKLLNHLAEGHSGVRASRAKAMLAARKDGQGGGS